MLDEALPTFFLKPSIDKKIKHHESFYFTQNGSEPEATYALRHLDPASNDAVNTYAVGLFDSHHPEILYGEVLSKPGWTQPSLSEEEIRRNGGVPPPPQPIFPTEFAIQLYNPDQQVTVKQQTSRWSSTASYEFSMPQNSFRTPSSSALDRTLNDPCVDATTPRINFVWKREGRLGKDMTCYMTGKSTDVTGKKAKKSKEPDIAVALFSGLKEITIMEPNLYRVEIEDYKGLEVVILLGGAAIRDLFFSSPRESYHILEQNTRKSSGGILARKGSSPLESPNIMPPTMTPQPRQPHRPAQRPMQQANASPPNALHSQPSRLDAKRSSLPPLETGSQPAPRLDPRRQWEIDAETARLKARVEAEAREQRRQAEVRRRKQEEEEERKTRQFLEEEERKRKQDEKERRRRQAEIDKETERLRRQFGDQSNLVRPAQREHRHSASIPQGPNHGPVPASWQPPRPGPYLQPHGPQPAASQSAFFSNGLPKPNARQHMKKKSFWGLGRSSDSNAGTLKKKQSSMF